MRYSFRNVGLLMISRRDSNLACSSNTFSCDASSSVCNPRFSRPQEGAQGHMIDFAVGQLPVEHGGADDRCDRRDGHRPDDKTAERRDRRGTTGSDGSAAALGPATAEAGALGLME